MVGSAGTVGSADPTNGLAGALKRAASATGAGFEFLLSTARRESGFNPTAKASGSSATGLFQFVEQTWFEMVKEEGPRFGLDDEAAKIGRTGSGRYVVSDPDDRRHILALRNDPEAAALMAGAFAERNRGVVSGAIGRDTSDGELYVAHFLGAQGAVDLIRLKESNGSTPAAPYFPEAAAANRAIFYHKGGKPKTAEEVYAGLVASHAGGASATASRGKLDSTGVRAIGEATADAEAGLAYNAGDQPFHSMFAVGGRRGAVSAYVDETWSNLSRIDVIGKRATDSRTTTALPLFLSAVPSGSGGVFGSGAGSARGTGGARIGAIDAPLDLSSFRRPDVAAAAKKTG